MMRSTSAVAVCCSSDSRSSFSKPSVLDGDDGLGSKVSYQLNLLVGKRANLLTINHDGADQFIVLEHRYCKVRSCAGKPRWRTGISR